MLCRHHNYFDFASCLRVSNLRFCSCFFLSHRLGVPLAAPFCRVGSADLTLTLTGWTRYSPPGNRRHSSRPAGASPFRSVPLFASHLVLVGDHLLATSPSFPATILVVRFTTFLCYLYAYFWMHGINRHPVICSPLSVTRSSIMFSHVRRSVITSIVPLCLPWLSCGSASLVRYQAARTARAVLYYAPAIAVASRDLHFLLSLLFISSSSS